MDTLIAAACAYMVDIMHTLGEIYHFDYETDLREIEEAVKKFREGRARISK